MNFIKRHFAILWDDYSNFKVIYSGNGMKYPNFGMLKKVLPSCNTFKFYTCFVYILLRTCLVMFVINSNEANLNNKLHKTCDSWTLWSWYSDWEKSPVSQCLSPVDNPTITYTNFYAEFDSLWYFKVWDCEKFQQLSDINIKGLVCFILISRENVFSSLVLKSYHSFHRKIEYGVAKVSWRNEIVS